MTNDIGLTLDRNIMDSADSNRELKYNNCNVYVKTEEFQIYSISTQSKGLENNVY